MMPFGKLVMAGSMAVVGSWQGVDSPAVAAERAHTIEIENTRILEIERPVELNLRIGVGESRWGQGFGPGDTDTTFAVNPSARLELRNHAGGIFVETWDRNEMRVVARHSRMEGVRVTASSSVVRLKSESRNSGWGVSSVVDYELTVPRTMPLDLSGVYTDISIAGTGSSVRAESVEGDVVVRGTTGPLSLRTVEGRIVVERSRGRVEANSVDEAILLSEIEGEIYAETIDGDIRLESIRSGSVEAKTVDGNVIYSGSLQNQGTYRFTTHDGDLVIFVPQGTNATVSVATFDGELESDFPVQITEAETRRRFSFVLGDGSAQLALYAFDGDIRLARPGAPVER